MPRPEEAEDNLRVSCWRAARLTTSHRGDLSIPWTLIAWRKEERIKGAVNLSTSGIGNDLLNQTSISAVSRATMERLIGEGVGRFDAMLG